MTPNISAYKNTREIIESLWAVRDEITIDSEQYLIGQKVSSDLLEAIDYGYLRVCEKQADGSWIVNSWIIDGIFLFFKCHQSTVYKTNYAIYYDKVPLKFHQNYNLHILEKRRIRIIPGAFIRKGAYIEDGVVLGPHCIVNVGAYIGRNSMIDFRASIGSCAWIGENCHISGEIGGVMEPQGKNPVIIGNNCFVGPNSSITEGVILGDNVVITAGVNISASTKIYNKDTKEITYGVVPSHSVVVPGVLNNGEYGVAAAIIVKKADDVTNSKTAINHILRDS